MHPGTPDINYSGGWIELKVDDWDSKGRLPLKHLTPQQKVWMFKRWNVGIESVHLMVQVGNKVLAMPADSKIMDCQLKTRMWWAANAWHMRLADASEILKYYCKHSSCKS